MLPKNSVLLKRARQLRRDMTPQERRMWYDFLKIYPVHIYRQKIIGNYIVDFYCASAKLVIELDGSQHFSDEALEYDKKRDAFLASCGLKVVRLLNDEVDRNFEGVCTYIDNLIKERAL